MAQHQCKECGMVENKHFPHCSKYKSLHSSPAADTVQGYSREQMQDCWKAAQYNLGGKVHDGYDTFETYIEKQRHTPPANGYTLQQVADALKKWKTILEKDAGKAITYSYKVLQEIINDFDLSSLTVQSGSGEDWVSAKPDSFIDGELYHFLIPVFYHNNANPPYWEIVTGYIDSNNSLISQVNNEDSGWVLSDVSYFKHIKNLPPVPPKSKPVNKQ